MDDQTPNLASPQSCCLRTECGTGLGPAGALAAGGSFSQAPERRLRAVLLLLGMIWSHWPFPFPGFLQTLFLEVCFNSFFSSHFFPLIPLSLCLLPTIHFSVTNCHSSLPPSSRAWLSPTRTFATQGSDFSDTGACVLRVGESFCYSRLKSSCTAAN